MASNMAFKCVTLTGTGSAQNIIVAAQAVDSTIGSYMATASILVLQADPGNSTNNIWIGDDQLSSTRIGYVLTSTSPGDPLILTSARNASDIPVANMYFQASGGSPKLNILVIP